MAHIRSTIYARALHDSLQKSDAGSVDAILEKFAALIVKHNQVRHIDKIIRAFVSLENKAAGTMTAKVVSATELSKDLVKKLEKSLKNVSDISYAVDETLIGGLSVQVDDVLLDGSVRAQLNHLHDTLTR